MGSNPALGTKLVARGDVAKWTKAEVCKTSIRRFESARRLQIKDLSALELKGLAEVAEW